MSARRHPWPALTFAAVLALGAFTREPPAAAAAPQASPLLASGGARAPARETVRTHTRELAYGTHPRQRFDLSMPAQPRGAPTIFFVHGGGWRMGDKGLAGIDAKRAHWTAAGAFVVSTNYRLVPDADPIEQARDVARALAAAQAEVMRQGGDGDGFVLMGHSAGAHLIALVMAEAGWAREFGLRPVRAGVLLDAGAIDTVATMQRRGGELPLFREAFGTDPAFWERASPVARLTSRTAPLLAVCAQARRDACADNRTFLAKAAGYGTRTQLLPKPLNHAQINRMLGEDAAYTAEVDAFLRGAGVTLR